MSVDLVYYNKGTVTETGLYPWQQPERDNWYAFSATRPDGTTLGRVKRTAHAAALGRAIFADTHKGDNSVVSVSVYEYDTDADTAPYVTADGSEMIEVENQPALAVITDPRPVGTDVEQFERDLEVARIAQHRYQAARAVALESMRTVHVASGNLDPSSPDHRSANALAAAVKGLVSRPTVLKLLTIHEADADL